MAAFGRWRAQVPPLRWSGPGHAGKRCYSIGRILPSFPSPSRSSLPSSFYSFSPLPLPFPFLPFSFSSLLLSPLSPLSAFPSRLSPPRPCPFLLAIPRLRPFVPCSPLLFSLVFRARPCRPRLSSLVASRFPCSPPFSALLPRPFRAACVVVFCLRPVGSVAGSPCLPLPRAGLLLRARWRLGGSGGPPPPGPGRRLVPGARRVAPARRRPRPAGSSCGGLRGRCVSPRCGRPSARSARRRLARLARAAGAVPPPPVAAGARRPLAGGRSLRAARSARPGGSRALASAVRLGRVRRGRRARALARSLGAAVLAPSLVARPRLLWYRHPVLLPV